MNGFRGGCELKDRILIVDSGMRNLGGHNFSYTRAVQKQLEAHGYVVDVLVHRDFPEELARDTGYRPTFSRGSYDFGPSSGLFRQLRYFRTAGGQFARELREALRDLDASRYSLVFSHTVNDFELIGWREVARDLPPSARLMLLMRYTPRFRAANRLKLALHPYWRIKPSNLNAIRGLLGDRFRLATDSEPLTEDYASIYRGPIVTLPIPINAHVLQLSTNGKRSVGEPLTIGYLGDARVVKGFPMLPALARRILERYGGRVRFSIQCPPSATGDASVLPEGLAELRAQAATCPAQITLVEKKLSEEEYADLLRSMDIVLIPYRRYGYVEPTSGIFAEAAALAKPVVVPRGTWMARELGRYGGGLEFDESIDDLGAKVEQLVSSYDEFRAKAAAFAPRWQSFHNAANVAGSILSSFGFAS